jgi:predicted amidophosphoribosyltransferase
MTAGVPCLVLWLQTAIDALLPPSCAACDAPTEKPLCARCLEAVEVTPDGTVLYGGPIANAVRAAKFGRDVTRAMALGRFWAEHMESCPQVDAITFVPAHWRRRVVRGFDLPAVLSSTIAKKHQLPLIDALVAVRKDPPLSFGADKAMRQLAVAGRYRVRRQVSGKRLLLVDDVKTTGATLNEASKVLSDAGAQVVIKPFAIVP